MYEILEIIDEDVHAFNPTQKEEDDAFFYQVPLVDTRDNLDITWMRKGKVWRQLTENKCGDSPKFKIHRE